MFTGIIETTANVTTLENRAGKFRLSITVNKSFTDDVVIGDSIAVNGVCLTVVSINNGNISFDMMQETAGRSTLAQLHSGDIINYERALSVGDRLGGHFVTGHIDTTSKISSRYSTGGEERFEIPLPVEFAHLLVEKGSVALDGISLTVAALKKNSFEVAIIPHTLSETTLGKSKQGTLINVEFDPIAKMVSRYLQTQTGQTGSLSLGDFSKHGFD